MDATNYADLAKLIEIPPDSTISRTIYQDEQVKAVLFGFAAGQELSEHTAATAAIIQIVSGKARMTLDGEAIDAQPNTWVHLPPRMPHGIVAETPVVMLLLLLKGKL